MKCPGCQQDSSATAKFCEHCGAPLSRRCANCGTTLSASARFCPECGRPAVADRFHSPESYTPKHLAARILTSKTALEGERKQVTVLFADVKSSMELLADRDPEEARTILDPLEIAAAKEQYGNALALAGQSGARPLVAHCHRGLGELYRRTDDTAKATAHTAMAQTMYGELGMRWWLEQARGDGTVAP
jgi:Double zinc ribbon